MAADGDSDIRRSWWIFTVLGGVVAAVVAAAVVVAVGDSDDNSSVQTAASTTTTGLFTSTTAASSPVTTNAPTVPAVPIVIPSKNDGTSPDGSGCSPPAGDSLPDGVWFGDLKAVDRATGTISLDLNCFFTNEAAATANQQDNGGPGDPVDDDYYIRNKVKKVYVLHAVPNVAVLELTAMGGGPLGTPKAGLDAAATMLADFDNSWIGWIQVSGGHVVVIQQQFVP
jgi:hypothetical protein